MGKGGCRNVRTFDSMPSFLEFCRHMALAKHCQCFGWFFLSVPIRDGMRFSITKRSGVYGDPGASFDPVGAVQDQQEANGRCSRISMELLSDFVIECRRNAPTWRLDSEKLIAT